MRTIEVCRSYFSGFHEISHACQNTAKVNALALAKILSYFTVILPLVFGVVYGIASLCGRAKLGCAKLRAKAEFNGNNDSNEKKLHLLPLQAQKFCSLARKEYLLTGKMEEVNALIEKALYCTNCNKSRTWEYIRNLNAIATTQLEVGLKDEALQTIKTTIPEIYHLSDTYLKINMYSSLATRLIPMDHKLAGELIEKAESEFAPYKEKDLYQYTGLVDAEKTLATTKKAWENAKNK